MTIHLSEQRERLILSLLRAGTFASSDEVINEGLRLVEERYRAAGNGEEGGGSARIAQQLENLRRLGQKLDALPTAAIAHGLSNRDHDRMLYGK